LSLSVALITSVYRPCCPPTITKPIIILLFC